MSGERVVVTADYLRCMGKLANKRKTRPSRIKKSVPTKTPRKLLDAKKFAGTVPGMASWALEEVRKMRDEW